MLFWGFCWLPVYCTELLISFNFYISDLFIVDASKWSNLKHESQRLPSIGAAEFPYYASVSLSRKTASIFLETGSPSIYIRNKLQEFVQKGPKLYTQMVWYVLSNHQKQLHVYKQMHMIYCFTPYLLFQYHSTCISFFSMHFQIEYNLLDCV